MEDFARALRDPRYGITTVLANSLAGNTTEGEFMKLRNPRTQRRLSKRLTVALVAVPTLLLVTAGPAAAQFESAYSDTRAANAQYFDSGDQLVARDLKADGHSAVGLWRWCELPSDACIFRYCDPVWAHSGVNTSTIQPCKSSDTWRPFRGAYVEYMACTGEWNGGPPHNVVGDDCGPWESGINN